MTPMLRYCGAAAALKLFSLNGTTRRLYRSFGNRYGQSRREKLSEIAVQRGFWLCQTAEPVLLGKQTRVLELGTGWMHFYAIFLRLVFETRITLLDIQDNRQLAALKSQFAQLADALPRILPAEYQHRSQGIQGLATQVATVRSFEQLYDLLDMDYVVVPDGSLSVFGDNEFDLVFSMDVLEHVDRGMLPDTVASIYRILKPGGLSVHQIGLDDHLTHYALNMPSKNYLRYSQKTWELFFQNQLQYINCVQLPEFQDLFQTGGFELLACRVDEDMQLLDQVVPHSRFSHFSAQSLQATRAYLAYRKPVTHK